MLNLFKLPPLVCSQPASPWRQRVRWDLFVPVLEKMTPMKGDDTDETAQ